MKIRVFRYVHSYFNKQSSFSMKDAKLIENGTGPSLVSGKFLSFFLGQEEYAIEILKVKEIIGLISITPVPKMPGYIRGVINLRGKIVPVMNLRIRFGLQPVEDTHETCIIVVQESQRIMGVLVDKVSEVAEITETQVEDVPSFGISENRSYLAGLARVKESVKMIVEVHKVLFDVPEEVLVQAQNPTNK